MTDIRYALRSGDWLTAERIRSYSLILLALTVLAVVGWTALSNGMVDRNGKPIGTDFSNVYAAGVLTLQGKAADAYDPPLQHAMEKTVFDGRDVPFFGWHYPPFFFAIAAITASLPYAGGLALWVFSSLAAYLAVMRAILPRPETPLVAMAFPAVLVCIGHGQNAFFTAALLGGALQIIDRRPWAAGVLIGLLAYKPQFGVLIPIALVAGSRWPTIAAACATIAALVAISIATLGTDIWHAFILSMNFTQTVVLEQGGTGWEKIQSVFSAARHWGADIHTAYALQGLLALALAAGIAWLWRSETAFALKASALATASLLATPYVLDYDLVVLAVAIAFFVRHGLAHGFHDYEISALAAAWFAPLVSRSIAGLTTIPLALIVELVLLALTMRRAANDRSAAVTIHTRIAQA